MTIKHHYTENFQVILIHGSHEHILRQCASFLNCCSCFHHDVALRLVLACYTLHCFCMLHVTLRLLLVPRCIIREFATFSRFQSLLFFALVHFAYYLPPCHTLGAHLLFVFVYAVTHFRVVTCHVALAYPCVFVSSHRGLLIPILACLT